MAGEARQPRFDGIQRLCHSGKAASRDDSFGMTQALVGFVRGCAHDDQRRGEEAEADELGSDLSQGRVNFLGLGHGVGVGECGLLLGQHLLDQR